MPTMPTRLKLCPSCEQLISAAYEMKKIPITPARASYKAEPCGWCGRKCVLMDEFEIRIKKREKA